MVNINRLERDWLRQAEFCPCYIMENRPYERKSLTKHLRRTFWLYKGIGMLKLEGMHRQTGETYVDPTAMLRQMREVSDF